MNKYILQTPFNLLLAALLLLTVVSCNKETAPTRSENNELYKLPQGNQPIDQWIMDFKTKYKTIFLYNFSHADFTYTFAGNVPKDAWATPAGPAHVEETIGFMKQHWLELYEESMLQKMLPFKVLLASKIENVLYDAATIVDTFTMSAIAGGDNIAFGLAGQTATLTPGQIDTARGELNGAFWEYAVRNNRIPLSPQFIALTPSYSTGIIKNIGIFRYRNGMTSYDDFSDYIKVICTTEYNTLVNTLFTPAADPNGLYKKKYDAIVNYYLANFGVDLKAIGNM